MATHVAIDIETMGLTTDSLVVSVGMVAFNGHTILSRLYTPINYQDQASRLVDARTVEWWSNQPAAVQEALFMSKSAFAPTVKRTHQMIEKFIELTKPAGVWGFGADFDNATMNHLFRSKGMDLPWSYRANRCGRTLKALFPEAAQPSSKGIHHNALADAEWLAESIMLINNFIINTKGVPSVL